MDEVDPHGDFPSTSPDSSGYGDDLRLSGVTRVAGRRGNALSFSGTGDDRTTARPARRLRARS
jgi:hypothetical protein